MSDKTVIIWFRQDLRLHANRAFLHAIRNKYAIVPVYIYEDRDLSKGGLGGATKWWLHQSLFSLQQNLQSVGSQLILRTGDPLNELKKLIKETKADLVFWNRLYEPDFIKRDKKIKQDLKEQVEVLSFKGNVLVEPWEIQNSSGNPYQVFTPYYKALIKLFKEENFSRFPSAILSPQKWPSSHKLKDLNLMPKIKWYKGFEDHWQVGENAAQKKLKEFLDNDVIDYSDKRNRPDLHKTSCLSPYLHFGELCAVDAYQKIQSYSFTHSKKGLTKNAESFLRQLVWRDFAYHLMYHFPYTVTKPLNEKFTKFPWSKKKSYLKKWQKGETGYPIVDAGMKELWHTGWMHNRVRMIVGSFLIKDLLIHWLEGAKWFWDTLLDADLANNTMGWQWVAGCGADAAPYFRIFNPILQGEKFDPEGEYVKKWIPALKNLPKKYIHKPFDAPQDVLDNANIKLGKDYPKPLVDHFEARDMALQAYNEIKS